MSETIHISRHGDWQQRADASYRKYGLFWGNLQKDMRRVAPQALYQDTLESTRNMYTLNPNLLTTLPTVPCTNTAVEVEIVRQKPESFKASEMAHDIFVAQMQIQDNDVKFELSKGATSYSIIRGKDKKSFFLSVTYHDGTNRVIKYDATENIKETPAGSLGADTTFKLTGEGFAEPRCVMNVVKTSAALSA